MHMSKQEKKELVPALRFPEFKDAGEWAVAPLMKLASRRSERNRDGNVTRVLTNSAEHGVVDQRDYFDKDIATQGNLENYFIVDEGDYVYNPRISAFAPVGPISKNGVGKGVMSPLYTVIRFKNPDSEFYAHYFKTNAWHSYMRKVGSTGARHDRMAISNDDFMAMPLPAPLPEERQKIADCLTSVDNLITAQTQKLDGLKTHKKGLMQQLFPAEGKTVPKLRFPEFRDKGEWIQASFGSLRLDVSDGNYSSKYPKQSDFLESGIPFLRANNLRFGTVSDEDMRYISEEQHSELTKGHLKKGDILISTRGELGTLALVPDRHIGSNINAQLVRINAAGKLDKHFLFQLLDFSRTVGEFDRLSTGTALKQLPIGKLNQLSLLIPKQKEEQQKIAECLTSIDELITSQAKKVEALKAHKKALVQQLFPAMDEVDI